jgi:hypothetical protein
MLMTRLPPHVGQDLDGLAVAAVEARRVLQRDGSPDDPSDLLQLDGMERRQRGRDDVAVRHVERVVAEHGHGLLDLGRVLGERVAVGERVHHVDLVDRAVLAVAARCHGVVDEVGDRHRQSLTQRTRSVQSG